MMNGLGSFSLRIPLLALLCAATFAPCAQAGGSVVALGDSYSSGEGVPPFEPGTATASDHCHRSASAWPILLAQTFQATARSFACSGAKFPDVVFDDPERNEPERRTAQIRRLAAASPTMVTLTIGGNDVGFAKVLTKCILQPDCRRFYVHGSHDSLDDAVAVLAAQLPDVYRRIRAAAPGATLVVADYPRIFAPKGHVCAFLIDGISPGEARYLNAKATVLNAAIAQAVQATNDRGVVFAEVRDALAGHEIRCFHRGWVHRVHLPWVQYSFHPTLAGQRAIAAAVAASLAAQGVAP